MTDGQWFEHRSVKHACAIKWGNREKVPWCFVETMADLSFAFIRGAEAVSGCSSIITFLLCLRTGGKYSPYKGFDTTAKEEAISLEVKLRCTRLLLNHSLVLQTTQNMTQTHVSSPPLPLGLQNSSAGSGRQSPSPLHFMMSAEEERSDREDRVVLLGFCFCKICCGFLLGLKFFHKLPQQPIFSLLPPGCSLRISA